jgi:hypothetical protein
MKAKIVSYDIITIAKRPVTNQGRYKVYPGITRKIDFVMLGFHDDYDAILLKSSSQLKKLIKHR